MSSQIQPTSAWSRRRAAVQAEADEGARAEERAVIDQKHAELAEKTEAEVLAELKLPNPDEMKQGDDFSAFMKSAVPAALRNRALRKLWVSNPVLANVDMLVDYGEDFTGKGDVIGAIKTIYRVGKGMLKDEAEKPEAVMAAPETPPEEIEQSEPAEIAEEPREIIEFQADDPTQVAIAPRRRMQFAFEDVDPATPLELDMT